MRTEKDSMGEMKVEDNALYGASTQRAVLNFPISGYPMPEDFVRTMGLVKYACAQANLELKLLSKEKAQLICDAAQEIIDGKLTEHFPIDAFQTGSATSSNMNCNEVIANRISQKLNKLIGSKEPIHPNDDVNMGQSSNDVMPTVLHVSVAVAINEKLIPALTHLEKTLSQKVNEWKDIVKIGRTHLMDATPLTLGQEFSAFAMQIHKGIERMHKAIDALKELAIGGTAVGTGINTHVEFGKRVAHILSDKTHIHFIEARNHFEAQAGRDDCVEVAGYFMTLCASLTKIANDIRMLGAGPRAGFFELSLPATQPGSSIMPGKVNPVMSEMLVQTCIYIQGLCSTVAMCGRDGHFQLNVTIPLIAFSLLESVRLLSNSIRAFTDFCVVGCQANKEQIKEHLHRSLMLVTALNPHIGYDKAAYVAKKAFTEHRTLRDVVLSEKLMDEKTLDNALDPKQMLHGLQ